MELGRKLLITTDQHHLILDYQIMDKPDEHPQAPATVERILAQYGPGSIKSISFDKGFSSKANKEQLQDVAGRVIMPKKGKCNAAEAAEEHQASDVKLRHAHSAVESNINSLEHHGLDRFPDKGFHGYQRYTGLGVIAYNLHQIGKGMLRQAKESEEKAAKRRQRQGRKKSQQDDIAASFLGPNCGTQPPRSPKRLDNRAHATPRIDISRHRGISKARKPPRESQKPPEPDLTNRPALAQIRKLTHFFSDTN